MMGQEPSEENMPPDLEDFPDEVHWSFTVYRYLKDVWDPMGGNYLGKDFSIVFKLFDLLEVPEYSRKIVFKIITHLDECRSSMISRKLSAKKSVEKPSH